jgi:hypothetical protein
MLRVNKMKRIYIAGKLNDMACDYIKNVSRMCRCAIEVQKCGFAVYVPGIDLLMGLVAGDMEYYKYFNNSQDWLKVSDAVFLTPGWETSQGTKREIELARSLNIPVFDDITQMKGYLECRI